MGSPLTVDFLLLILLKYSNLNYLVNRIKAYFFLHNIIQGTGTCRFLFVQWNPYRLTEFWR